METLQRLQCLWVVFLSSFLISSCTIFIPDPIDNNLLPIQRIEQAQIQGLVNKELLDVEKPERKPVIAVYANSFRDETGARRSTASLLHFLQLLLKRHMLI